MLTGSAIEARNRRSRAYNRAFRDGRAPAPPPCSRWLGAAVLAAAFAFATFAQAYDEPMPSGRASRTRWSTITRRGLRPAAPTRDADELIARLS
jgi:hypothetical protein